MTRLTIAGAGLLLTGVFVTTLIGQDAAAEVAAIPALQGVYYRAPSEWVALPFTIISPSLKSSAKLAKG